MNKNVKLMLGDNMESLKKLEDNSIDSVVTDGPYGLSFMNKKWDYNVPSVEFWTEVYRVLKPGGHILSFGGTRTYHRMVVNIEDAGFEIRDQIMWVYGSGFPKSLNIGKGIDKKLGNEREEYIDEYFLRKNPDNGQSLKGIINMGLQDGIKGAIRSKGNSEYEGWGTGLKPANEPIVLARKPISEKTIVENVLKWGTGGINVDGCRIGSDIITTNGVGSDWQYKSRNGIEQEPQEPHEGRFPSNFIIECICDEVIKGEKGERSGANYERTYNDNNPSYVVNSVKSGEHYNDKGDIHTNPMCPCYMLDEQSGVSKSVKRKKVSNTITKPNIDFGGGIKNIDNEYEDTGGASRFFYVPKVSKKERNMGLDGKFNVEILTPTIKLLYLDKNKLWVKEDQKTKLVDTDKSHQKDIEEYIITDEYKWSIELYGKVLTEQFLMDAKYTIETETNSTTILETLNSLIEKNIKTNIQELNGLTVKDIKFVKDVENKNIKIIFILQNKDGYSQNVNYVELSEVWNINIIQNKSTHPTVKPINLLTYLVRLVTPPNGVVMDCFMGYG